MRIWAAGNNGFQGASPDIKVFVLYHDPAKHRRIASDPRDIMYSFAQGGDIPGYFERYRRRLDTRNDIGHHGGLSRGDARRLRRLYP